MGIEPTYPAWKAGVLPLNYTRILLFATCKIYQNKCHVSRTFPKKSRHMAEIRSTFAKRYYILLSWQVK